MRPTPAVTVYFRALCGYCGTLSKFYSVGEALCDENEEDRYFEAPCCNNCGEYSGAILRLVTPDSINDRDVE